MHELALFAGAGGGILGGHLLGWRTVCAVELDRYAASVLVARQNDGALPAFPIWDDIRDFDGRPWRGRVDVISGGFPCQDISPAGKGKGIEGERSGLWSQMVRIIREVEPRFVFVENSPMLVSRGLGRVLGDLAAMGFDARWCVLGAADAGAPHKRERIWILAHSKQVRLSRCAIDERPFALDSAKGREGCDGNQPPVPVARCSADVANANEARPQVGVVHVGHHTFAGDRKLQGPTWWKTEPNVGRVAHGVAARVDRLAAIGNGQVPAVAALAWRTLSRGWVTE